MDELKTSIIFLILQNELKFHLNRQQECIIFCFIEGDRLDWIFMQNFKWFIMKVFPKTSKYSVNIIKMWDFDLRKYLQTKEHMFKCWIVYTIDFLFQ